MLLTTNGKVFFVKLCTIKVNKVIDCFISIEVYLSQSTANNTPTGMCKCSLSLSLSL